MLTADRPGGLTADNWYTGNATDDAQAHRGWLPGNFIQPDDSVRATPDVEVKWGIHPAGQGRSDRYTGETRTSMLILVSGRFRQELSVRTVVLEHPGDYVVWGPGIDHTWQAEADSVVITIRWPSLVK
jgi:hypothetical protein